jgi:Protein of unknown function (DUF559).
MDVRLAELAAGQGDLIARWQLVAAGWSVDMVREHARRRGWRRVHSGVYALGQAPLTQWQRWMAATLTAPGTVLSHAGAGACCGFRPWDGMIQTVTRPGSGGRRHMGLLLVARSRTLGGETTEKDGIPITTAARTLMDLFPHLGARQQERAFREAVRLKTTTIAEIEATLARHPGRRGTASLAALCRRYATIPYARTRSDAEGKALERILDKGHELPAVNVKINGVEADLVDHDQRLIIEIDGPQFHLFPDEDARKEAAWKAKGYTVERVGSDDVYRD